MTTLTEGASWENLSLTSNQINDISMPKTHQINYYATHDIFKQCKRSSLFVKDVVNVTFSGRL